MIEFLCDRFASEGSLLSATQTKAKNFFVCRILKPKMKLDLGCFQACCHRSSNSIHNRNIPRNNNQKVLQKVEIQKIEVLIKDCP